VGLFEMLPGLMGTAFPLLKSLRAHYGRHCEPFSGQKRTRLQDFEHTTQSQKLSEVILPEPRRSAPRTRTQTQISTCLASNHIPIVPVLRNDHWPHPLMDIRQGAKDTWTIIKRVEELKPDATLMSSTVPPHHRR